MLKMGILIPILGCLTFTAVGATEVLVYEKTPVWISSYDNETKSPSYKLVEGEIVKEAIEDWKRTIPFGIQNTRIYNNTRRYGRDVSETTVADWERCHPLLIRSDCPPTPPDPVTEEWRSCYRFLLRYACPPSTPAPPVERFVHVMLVLDYLKGGPIVEASERWYVRDKIVHALAMWNGIHRNLKSAKDVRYKIRIVGIVIASDKESVPYVHLHENKYGELFDVATAAKKAVTYWEQIALTNPQFPLDARQVTAIMTDSKVPQRTQEWGISGRDDIHTFVWSDNFGRGLQELNPKHLADSMSRWSRLNVTNYFCPSCGNPITDIPLPGQIISLNKQCESWLFKPNNEVCFGKSSPCDDLACRNLEANRQCDAVKLEYYSKVHALDGSFCGDRSICINGACVLDTKGIRTYHHFT